ncbi:ISXO2-like transposase domain protein [compost metagenome]
MCKNKNKYTIKQFREEYPDDDACLNKIFKLTYGDMTECPKCGCTKSFVRVKTRQCYQCPKCYYQVFPCAGTVFHRTRTPLTYWFFAIFLFTISKNGLSACELQRHLGVTYKTAFRMLKQIRTLITNDDSIMSGVIELDESYVGGKNKNRHKDKKVKNSQGRAYKDKSPVFGILERSEEGTSRVIAYTVPDVKSQTLKPLIYDKVEAGSAIMTDEWNSYTGLNKDYEHGICFHGRGNYVSGENNEVYTNGLENFWSTVKRGINGSYIHVSPKYLQLYINEFVFRFNNRNSPEMFNDLINCLAS